MWYLNGVSDDNARERELNAAKVVAAVNNLNREQDIYDNALNLRLDCIKDVSNNNGNIVDWHSLYDFIRTLGGNTASDFADQLQADFDTRNTLKSVEEDCKQYPVPTPPEIPDILIQEGIYEP